MKGFYITMSITEKSGNVSLYYYGGKYTTKHHIMQIKWTGADNKKIFKMRKSAEKNLAFINAIYKGVEDVSIDLNEF